MVFGSVEDVVKMVNRLWKVSVGVVELWFEYVRVVVFLDEDMCCGVGGGWWFCKELIIVFGVEL